MKSNFNTVVFVARENLKVSGIAIALGHVHQMLAAGLGYTALLRSKRPQRRSLGSRGGLCDPRCPRNDRPCYCPRL